jgi:endonuclease/exonuclease/phosphatase family metal-dependent hydrolase
MQHSVRMISISRSIASILSVVFFLLVLSLGGCKVTKEETKEETAAPAVAPLFSVKILSVNMNKGKNIGALSNLKKLAEIIKQNEIDIVALQDISIPITASRPDYVKELKKLTDMELALGTNRLPQMGEHGNAILSRLPIMKTDNLMLPALKKNNDHGVLYAAIDLGAMKVIMINTHLDEAIGDKDEQRIAEAFKKLQGQFSEYQMFICATFYDEQNSPLLKTLSASYTSAITSNTYPASEPKQQYSYVFYPRQSNFTTEDRRTFDTGISTHRAIIAKLTYMAVPPGWKAK